MKCLSRFYLAFFKLATIFFICASCRCTSRTMAKFCANLSFMFTEQPFLTRYKLAREAGFKAVESGFPLGIETDALVNALKENNIRQILVNVYTGDVTKGERGFAALPDKIDDFNQSLNTTLKYAEALGVQKIHVMSGQVESATQDNYNIYVQNLRKAAEFFQPKNMLCLIEPINNDDIPNYYMNSLDKALQVVKDVNHPNLKIMFDIYHIQKTSGNIVNTLKRIMPMIGHIQLAQVPNRNEPHKDGELNYPYIFKMINEYGYKDWIGLEYTPSNGTEAGLDWIQKFGYKL